MAVVNVLTRSTALTVVVTLFTYFISAAVSAFAPAFSFNPKWLAKSLEGIYWITPRFVGMAKSIVDVRKVSSFESEPFIHAIGFSVVAFGLALYILSRKDYTT
jgi:hypothetical protein